PRLAARRPDGPARPGRHPDAGGPLHRPSRAARAAPLAPRRRGGGADRLGTRGGDGRPLRGHRRHPPRRPPDRPGRHVSEPVPVVARTAARRIRFQGRAARVLAIIGLVLAGLITLLLIGVDVGPVPFLTGLVLATV